MFRYELLFPMAVTKRKLELAAKNDAVLVNRVFGIEVTEPELAARCSFGNLDPQHSGGDASRTAIEEALSVKLPPNGITLATIRADLDSVGAMAIISMRADAEAFRPAEVNRDSTGPMAAPVVWQRGSVVLSRVAKVAAADKFARGGYPGPRPLPTRDNPWPEGSASAESSRPLAAIAAAIADFKIPLWWRVHWMKEWLLIGEEPDPAEYFVERYLNEGRWGGWNGMVLPEQVAKYRGELSPEEGTPYRIRVERERLDMIAALESGAIRVETRESGRIAVVESTHRAATMIGYALAPVVVACNPEFKLGGGEAHVKFTVCAFEVGKFVDIRSALAELATLEPGWAGSPTIGGSPQGVSSVLTIDQVVEVVAKHLKG